MLNRLSSSVLNCCAFDASGDGTTRAMPLSLSLPLCRLLRPLTLRLLALWLLLFPLALLFTDSTDCDLRTGCSALAVGPVLLLLLLFSGAITEATEAAVCCESEVTTTPSSQKHRD